MFEAKSALFNYKIEEELDVLGFIIENQSLSQKLKTYAPIGKA